MWENIVDMKDVTFAALYVLPADSNIEYLELLKKHGSTISYHHVDAHMNTWAELCGPTFRPVIPWH